MIAICIVFYGEITFITSLDKQIHLQGDCFRKMSLFCSVLNRSLPQNTIYHTQFSGRPYFGGGNMTIGEKRPYEVRTIHYIVVLPIGISEGNVKKKLYRSVSLFSRGI